MSRRTVVVLMAAGLVAAVLVYAMSGVSATERVRRYFRIDASTTDTIRAGLLLKAPVGTPASAIVAFLESHGVGHNSVSRAKREEREVQCQLDSDERAMTWAGAESHIHIYFELDASDRLREIKVTKSILRL